MPEFFKAPETVIHLAAEIIREHHEQLQGASIGFIFRDFAAMRNGRSVIGEASLIPEKLKPYANLDFLITLAEDEWNAANDEQRRAYLDHELCHCMYHQGRPRIRPHDVEEFAVIIKRYGPYRRDLQRADTAFKFAEHHLPGFSQTPTLVALDPAYFGE